MINAYYNGKYSDIDEVRIPLTDRAVFFGDGVYDAMIGERGKVYLETEHIDRLFHNAESVGLTVSVCKAELSTIIHKVIKDFDSPYFIYVHLSRYSKQRKHAAKTDAPANVLVTASPFSLPTKDATVSLTEVRDIRYGMCNVKTLNLLPSVLASTYAERNGFDEAVFVKDGYVTECAHSNISIIKDNTVITHPDSPCILPGITKAHLLRSARTLGIMVLERPFTPKELREADSVLVTSTSKLVLEAKSIGTYPLKIKENETARMLINTAFSNYWKDMEK
jgi:D-alanine transaminase